MNFFQNSFLLQFLVFLMACFLLSVNADPTKKGDYPNPTKKSDPVLDPLTGQCIKSCVG